MSEDHDRSFALPPNFQRRDDFKFPSEIIDVIYDKWKSGAYAYLADGSVYRCDDLQATPQVWTKVESASE